MDVVPIEPNKEKMVEEKSKGLGLAEVDKAVKAVKFITEVALYTIKRLKEIEESNRSEAQKIIDRVHLRLEIERKRPAQL